MKLWDKGYRLDRAVERYTVGDDYQLDAALVKYDCIASIAHARALHKAGVLSGSERNKLIRELRHILALDRQGKFSILPEDEDGHTAIEKFLTSALGPLGKKIHTARSRNDQVVTAIRLYSKEKLLETGNRIDALVKALQHKAGKSRQIRMPGYTHARKAMPSSFAAWLEAFAESMRDDKILIRAALELLDRNPLGTGAGYGIPVFTIDRSQTARELGFSRLQKSSLYVQNSRGKFEAVTVSALSNVMLDVNRMCSDLILFSMDEFGFIRLPKEICTGSSIMPQKMNPDVLEIARASYHTVIADEHLIKGIIGNLMSGYNRDLQLTKKPLMESFEIVASTLSIMIPVIDGIEVNEEKCMLACTPEIYATEEAYRLVASGMPFRDAYRKVAEKYSGTSAKSHKRSFHAQTERHRQSHDHRIRSYRDRTGM
jgi:argininosuccinate lyase